jgi:phosphopantothenoylcysteine decarboxylase/phosphopantothenate--cysteine ligase
LVGFAAETEEVELRAKSKLYAKGVDLIVANDITEPGAGFENDTNAVLIVSAGSVERVPLTTKREVAGLVLDRALSLLSRREPTSG